MCVCVLGGGGGGGGGMADRMCNKSMGFFSLGHRTAVIETSAYTGRLV